MKPKPLISLVGEQPIPNLLVSRYLEPENHLLVYTRRTEAVARRLRRLIGEPDDLSQDLFCEPYAFEDLVAGLHQGLPNPTSAQVNLTGGTKLMSLGAYAWAIETGSPLVYYENEGRRLLVYSHEMGRPWLDSAQVLPPLIKLDDYLRAHWDDYSVNTHLINRQDQPRDGDLFEQAVYQALSTRCDEVLRSVRPKGVADQIEIDLLVRVGNQVAALELKLGGNQDSGKKGMGQLKLAAEATYLGAYTRQVLVVGAADLNNKIKTLAADRNIKIVYIPEYQHGQNLSKPVAERLTRDITQVLEPPTRKK